MAADYDVIVWMGEITGPKGLEARLTPDERASLATIDALLARRQGLTPELRMRLSEIWLRVAAN